MPAGASERAEAFMERIEAFEGYRVEAAAPASPPRMEPIARAARQPADMAPAKSEAYSEPEPAAPSEERDVRG